MPTGGDDRLEINRDVIVTALIDRLIVDFSHIITDDFFTRAHRTTTALPFPYLITDLCWQANIPLISEIDNEVWEMHK